MTEPRTRRPLSEWAPTPVVTSPARTRAGTEPPKRTRPPSVARPAVAREQEARRPAVAQKEARRPAVARQKEGRRPAVARQKEARRPAVAREKEARRPAVAQKEGRRPAAGPTPARRASSVPGRPRPGGDDPSRLHPTAGGILPTRSGAAAAVAPEVQPEPARTRADPPRHLRVVAPRRRSARGRARVLFVVGSLAAVAVAFGLVYLHVLSAQKQFELNGLNKTEEAARLTYGQLRGQVETDNSPARIMAAAAKLHLVVPLQITSVPAVTGGTVLPTADPPAVTGSIAPAGAAGWSRTKRDVAGTP